MPWLGNQQLQGLQLSWAQTPTCCGGDRAAWELGMPKGCCCQTVPTWRFGSRQFQIVAGCSSSSCFAVPTAPGHVAGGLA